MSQIPENDGHQGRKASGIRVVLSLVPLAAFGVLAIIFFLQLTGGKDIKAIPSALIGTRAPALSMPALDGSGKPALTDTVIRGKLTLINVFASWCIPCREEHPLLLQLANDSRLQLVAINYKDKPEKALQFLQELGNPFAAIGTDMTGTTAIDWGVYGVPESYLVSADGTVLFKKVGPFDAASIANQLEPEIVKALTATASDAAK
jgi:cytochrome c biogenesis protein CcmG/thiol:disulfide interchange protein DsbE